MDRQKMINDLAIKKHTATHDKYQKAIEYLKMHGKFQQCVTDKWVI